MAEKKIPVLTEVYKPNKGAKSEQAAPFELTDELLGKVIAQLKPQLETDITDAVLDKVNQSSSAEQKEVALDVTDEMLERVAAQLKPQLETDIADTVLNKVSQPSTAEPKKLHWM